MRLICSLSWATFSRSWTTGCLKHPLRTCHRVACVTTAYACASARMWKRMGPPFRLLRLTLFCKVTGRFSWHRYAARKCKVEPSSCAVRVCQVQQRNNPRRRTQIRSRNSRNIHACVLQKIRMPVLATFSSLQKLVVRACKFLLLTLITSSKSTSFSAECFAGAGHAWLIVANSKAQAHVARTWPGGVHFERKFCLF
jgi:hypothetical protein